MHLQTRGSAEAPGGRVAAPAGKVLSLGAVNGWRGPGAICIAVGHFGITTDVFSAGRLEPLRLLVDMFFVFSGFVIAQAYAEKLRRPSAFPEYVIRRFGRIWPLQAATLGVLVAYELLKVIVAMATGHAFSSPPFSANGNNVAAAIPTNLLLLQSLGLHDRETWNFPSWSLSVEFATYVLFAAFCLLPPVPRRLMMGVAIAASMAVLMFVAPSGMRSTFDYGIFRCIAGFLVGTLCYDVAARWPLPRFPLPTLVETATVALLGAWLYASTGTVAVFAAPLVFSVLIIVFVEERGAISRLLLTKPAQAIANLSFAIYMTHAIVLIVLLAVARAFAQAAGRQWFVTTVNPLVGRPGAHPLIQVLHLPSTAAILAVGSLYITCVIVASAAAYWLVEVPGRAFFSRIGRRFAPVTSTAFAASRTSSTKAGQSGAAQWDDAAIGTQP